MVKVDFTIWQSFDQCPAWWRNFVITTCKNIPARVGDEDTRNAALDAALSHYHCRIIDLTDTGHGLDYLEFETDIDYLAFKLVWM